jgi:hypothetical protein
MRLDGRRSPGDDRMSQPTPRTQESVAAYRRVRVGFALMGLGVLVAGVIYLGALPGGLVLVLLLGSPPLLGYVFLSVRSLAASVFAGLALLAVFIGITLYVIGEAASSTAGVGYLGLPVVGFPVVLVATFLEGAIRSPSGSVVAGVGLVAVTIGTMLYLTRESAAKSFCDHANGLGNTMIEVGDGPLTASGAERLAAFHPDFLGDSEALRDDSLIESAHVAEAWAGTLADIRDADTVAERSAAYQHLRRVVKDLYGSTGICPRLR